MHEQETNMSFVTDPKEGRGAVVWGALAIVAGVIIVVALSGCANMRPVITENGGGGVAITTQQGSWLQPVLLTAGGVYLAAEIIKALEDKGSDTDNTGTYIVNSGDGTVNVNSQNDNSSAAHAKRVKSAAVTGRRK